METREIFEVMTNDCSNASYVMDYDTEELVYINQAMEKKFQIFEEYKGKKAYEVIPFFMDICGFEDKSLVQEGTFLETVFTSDVANANFRTKAIIWNISGKKYIYTKYFLAPSNDKKKEAENLFERAIAQCLEVLSDSSKPTIYGLLELIGQFYSCHHSYIYEFDKENQSLTNYYLWSHDNSLREMPENTNQLSLSDFIHWLETDYNRGKNVINLDCTNFIYATDTIEAKILHGYQVENLTIAKLWDKDGVLQGVIGLTNRPDVMYDDRLLQAVSHFIMEQFNQNNLVEAMEEWNDIDLLTGFYGRGKYTQKLISYEQNPPKSLGVIFVNLNGLRTTNEYLGYEAGDEQLKKTSNILNEYFNSSFYRVTGDEFIGFVEDCDKDIFEETVDSLHKRLKEQHNEATFSFGHSWEKKDYSVTNMIKVADAVMLINKQAFYHEQISDTEKITNAILKDLFSALSNHEFLVYLQPQVDLKTEKVVGAEALIRRFDKKKDKMVFPDSFIPLYEKNSVIRHVDLFVLEEVAKIIQSWLKIGKEIPISVNLSRVTLMEHGIVQTLTEIVDKYQIPHHLVIMEITERVGLIENDVASSLVKEFQGNHFKLSLDDFGCAYSNIVTLAKIEFDEVKIDKSLVDDVLIHEKNAVIVESMLSMCNRMSHTHTLAEGIETQEQADFLCRSNCQLGQGYLYSRPIPHEEFTGKYISLDL
ncbi:MAG: GGDEF domain-containing phosphodiesterase [Eubacteriales bacterium]